MRPLLLIAFMLTILSLHATQIYWTGTNSIAWDDGGNWDLGRIPIASDSVFTFYGDNIAIPVGYTARAKYVRLLGNLTINPSGQLIIKDGAFDAWGNVTNYGTIKVQTSPREEIYFRTQASDVEFHNYGEILIDQAAEEGLLIWNGQVFTNHNDPTLLGKVTITNCGKASLHLLIGTFVNEGILQLGSTTEGIALKIENTLSEFINNSCGKTVLLNGLSFIEGSFTNYGFFRQNFDGDNDIDASNTFLANYASIEDINNSFNVLDFDVQSIWTNEVSSEIRTGDTSVFFVPSLPSGFVISDVFADALLTITAGPVDLTTNTWVPNANANGLTRFYYEINDNSNCKDIVQFDVSMPVIAVTYWVGLETGSWQFGFNWNTGITPTINDNVAIYDPTVTVNIPLSYQAFARTLDLRGKLNITALASFELDGQGDNVGITTSDGAEIVNNGTLLISDVFTGIKATNTTIINNNTTSFTQIYTEGIDIRTNSPGSSELSNNGTLQVNNANLIDADETPFFNRGLLLVNEPIGYAINCENLINTGTIEITGANKTGKGFLGTIINRFGASIIVDNLDNGLYFQGGDNFGVISAHNCNTGITIDGDFSNSSTATMDITGCNIGVYHTDEDFNNFDGAHIRILNSGQSGFVQSSLSSQAKFYNKGFLEISDSELYGIECLKDVFNQDNGKITITNSGNSGLFVYALSAEFFNEDQAIIEIKNSTQYGILMQGGTFNNKDNGQIIIDTAQMAGILIDEFTTGGIAPGVFTNSSTIEIGRDFSATGIEIEPFCSFTNEACNGNICNFGTFVNDGTFTNDGIYRHLGYGINNSTLPISNNGILYDPNHTIPLSNISNLNVVIQEKNGSFDEEEIIPAFLNVNYPLDPNFEIESPFYVDGQLQTVGGQFNTNINEFMVANAAVGASEFYFRIRALGCPSMDIDTFKLPLQNPINKICKQLTWNGGKGQWTDASKWDIGRTPSTCDQASVNGILDSVLVFDTNTITIDAIQNFGFLQISPSSQIDLLGSATHGIRNQGRIINNGTLQIVNPTLNGYFGESNSIFTNNGTLNVFNPMQAAIRLKGNSILYQKGLLDIQ
ncbi:hypothetical protein [Portibacter marinus]|uniref:hypothetical protein n=1 Tax=Portibacter marinus TaxID=2898660 RepID=UPI001F1BBAD4|nr:hypothetical protein [Portibacter marinus]